MPNAVQRAKARRANRAGTVSQQDQWFIDQVSNKVKLTAKQRMTLAVDYLQNKVVKNISIPVERIGSRVVRSKPGEYPRADTTQLMRTVFGEVRETSPGIYDGYVGTPLDYGLRLELFMQRSFLVRTWNEQKAKIMGILTGPIK